LWSSSSVFIFFLSSLSLCKFFHVPTSDRHSGLFHIFLWNYTYHLVFYFKINYTRENMPNYELGTFYLAHHCTVERLFFAEGNRLQSLLKLQGHLKPKNTPVCTRVFS
jgi:hypothetical protein